MRDPLLDPPKSEPGRTIWNWFARHSDDRSVRRLRRLVHTAGRYVHAENHDITTNGETRLLDLLGPDADLILDVGACVGDWALEAARRAPSAEIHCFEIVSPTRRTLETRTRNEPRIHVVPTGLAESEGRARVKYYEARPGWSSVYDYPHDAPSVWLEETVTTGDSYLEEIGNPSVDLLKVDAEGAELAILRGFRKALSSGSVRVIQFEYGYAAVLSHGLLRDFYALLDPLGYKIGRLGRVGVDFHPYSLGNENFFGPNMVAIRASEQRLLGSLVAGR
jgi:FkbM family methyltransferase